MVEARNLVLAFKKNHYYIFYYLSETQQKMEESPKKEVR